MITYLYAFPDTLAVIKQGYKNFLFADIYNIHTLEYVADSIAGIPVGGRLVWSEEEYDSFIASYMNNFNDRDTNYLLGFDNEDIVGLLLSNFETMFNQRVDKEIEIIDLRLGGNGMFGDFLFKLDEDYFDEDLIDELIGQGIEVNRDKVNAIVRNRGIPADHPKGIPPEASRIIWLEQARFAHIIDEHKEDFKDKFEIWDDATTIGNFIFNAIKGFPIVNTFSGAGGQSKFYVYEILKTGNYLKVLVHNDGSIITAFPSEYDN